MQLTTTLLALLALGTSVVAATRREDRQWNQGDVGGPHGSDYNDEHFATEPGHKRIAGINMAGCGKHEHLTMIEFSWRDNIAQGSAPLVKSRHGKPYGHWQSLDLAKDEWINEVLVHTWQAKKGFMNDIERTRVGHVKFSTNKGRSISCGSYYEDDGGHLFPQSDSALLYLSGRQGDAIDMLRVHWIPKEDF